MFEKVQARLEEQRVARAARLRSRALLLGKLFNEAGERLTPTYATKDGVRYGYYVSTSAMQSRDRVASPMHRLPAAALETAVVNALQSVVEKRGPQGTEIETSTDAQPIGCPVIGISQPRTPSFRSSAAPQAQALIDTRLVRVAVLPDRLEIDYCADPNDRSTTETLSIPWTKPASRVRRALLEPSSSTAPSRPMESDERNRLIRSIAAARSWLEALVKGSVRDIAELAARENRTPRSIRMTLSLASSTRPLSTRHAREPFLAAMASRGSRIFRRALRISGERSASPGRRYPDHLDQPEPSGSLRSPILLRVGAR